MKRDYCEILGVDKNANEGTIKKAYRKVAMQYHPDRNPGDKAAEEKFKEAAEAYEVLSDANKKAKYERYGHAGVENMGGGFSGGSMEDIFQHLGDIFGDGGSPFESFFGNQGGRSRTSSGQKGSNLRIKVSLTLEEIESGVTKNNGSSPTAPDPAKNQAPVRRPFSLKTVLVKSTRFSAVSKPG